MLRLSNTRTPLPGSAWRPILPLNIKVPFAGISCSRTHRGLRTPVQAAHKGVASKVNGNYNRAALQQLMAPEASSPCKWTYNYHTSPEGVPRGMTFVPMVFGRASFKSDGDLTSSAYGELQTHGAASKHIMGFNEPDGDSKDSANILVEDAVLFWDKVHYTAKLPNVGAYLGSPAMGGVPLRVNGGMVDAATPGCWLDQFLTESDRRVNGDPADFICVHWYPEHTNPSTDQDIEDAVGTMTNFLKRVHERYRKPVWLTEFSLVTYDNKGEPNAWPSLEVQAKFLKKAAEKMNRMDFVHRYAWFDLPPWKGTTVSLFGDETTPSINILGKAFQSV